MLYNTYINKPFLNPSKVIGLLHYRYEVIFKQFLDFKIQNRTIFFQIVSCTIVMLTFLICISIAFRDDVREKMHSRYLSNPDYTFEKVNRASMACGPMVKWAVAQVIFLHT